MCKRQHGATELAELAELVKLVAAEVISEAEATRRAMATEWAWDDDQVPGAAETVRWWLRKGDRKTARILASLLMTAVERARPEPRRQASLAFVRAATEVVALELDGALYRQAADVAERFLPNADNETLLAIADLKLEPFAVDPILGSYPQRERARRERLSLLSSGFPDEPGMPARVNRRTRTMNRSPVARSGASRVAEGLTESDSPPTAERPATGGRAGERNPAVGVVCFGIRITLALGRNLPGYSLNQSAEFGRAVLLRILSPNSSHCAARASEGTSRRNVSMPMSPNQGPTSGGTVVTITGTNLGGATAVHFGLNEATITANTPTQVTVINPAGAGVVPTTVTTVGGTSNSLPFYYIQPPFKFGISDSSGPVAGGNTVTLSGTNLTTATSVDFGGNTATPTVINDGTISVAVPAAAAAGTVPITVTTAGGVTNGLTYTYVDLPTIISLSPTSGPTSGGTVVSIIGTALTTTTSVTFGGTPANFSVVSDTLVTAVTPSGTAGPVDVVVTTTGGSATAAGAFTYNAGPSI